ncbi:hydroxymethylglutaryl-CoA lyase [Novosphingobium kunmingense]|uniref:Hydroxymethylglutaryl-CoA lyase n=1 Tax=Novosphingobium kunmingense TaxID=1211806 RepID=A0A2N0H6N8_9SPHN|nr:hydroxymethylglutaryl-CoA lyase [Novosphingobium kunmingense]PKB14582.1 hydroxymethylglutaryl-CoA lyase [Novosphingobium kunmingense]
MATIEIVEVSARDGLQNETQTIFSTGQKIELIQRMVTAGARRLEVASFVRPDAVPQMADAEAVVAGLDLPDNVITIGLVMNKRGALRALETNVRELGAVCVASDSFAKANQGQTSMGSVEIAGEILRLARQEGRRAQVTIGAAFGCPFEGEVDPSHVLAMAARLVDAGPVELALADTIGVAVPRQVHNLVSRLRELASGLPIRVHLHNTRNTGYANALAAIEAGAATLDASVGGIGGCPFAPNATGNIATEDLLYLLERSGISTGLDSAVTIDTARWLSGEMSRAVPGLLSRAGSFPSSNQLQG